MYRYMGYTDRQKIQVMWEAGRTAKEIAEALGMQLATVYRELKRGEDGRYDKNQRRVYDADLAQHRYHENLKRRGKRVV